MNMNFSPNLLCFSTLTSLMLVYSCQTLLVGPSTEKYQKVLITLEKILLIGSNLILGLILIWRWVDSNHFPLSSLYESLIFLVWSLTFIQILISNGVSRATATATATATSGIAPGIGRASAVENGRFFSLLGLEEEFSEPLKEGPSEKALDSLPIGIILSPIVLLIYSFATFTLPETMQKAAPLTPALQSNWLFMHVTMMILSYASLIAGSLLAISYLIFLKLNKFASEG